MADFLTRAQEYLDFVLSADRLGESEDVRVNQLIQILDRLALEAEIISVGPSDIETSQKQVDYKTLYQKIGANFPELGKYSTVLDTDPNKAENNWCVGDAIDDLADIAGDLLAVVGASEIFGMDAAKQEFNFRFRIHWGFHMRELQLYLYCRCTGF